MFLRQSTASQEVLLGPFLDDTDGKTAETGLTINNTDIKIWKGGATTEANKNSGGATHIASGRYYAVLDATDTDTLGLMELNVHVSGALPVRRGYIVLPANVYDSIVAGSDYLDISAVQFAGQTITCSGGVTVPAATLASTTGAVGSVTGNVGGNVSGSVGSVAGNVTGTVASVVGNVGGNVVGSVASVTGAVGSVTGNVGGSVASVATGGITSASFASGAITAAAIAADAIGASELAADAVAEIADAVWDETLSGHLTAGSTGNALNAAGSAGDPWSTSLPGAYGAGSAGYIIGTNLDAAVTSRLAPTTAGRTLDVSAGGEAGVDWANVGSPTTTLNLSGTTISTSQAVASVSGAVGSVTGSVGSIGTGGITAASIATDAIDADALAADAANEIADALLARNVSGGSSTGRTVKQALHFLRNKWVSSSGTLTVYDTDDATPSWTSTVTTAAVDPVISSDPA